MSTPSGGGSYMDASGDQPAIRSMAAQTDFMQPANPLPAQYAGGSGGLGSQLGALGAQPAMNPLENPANAPSITQGAPGMTAMLGALGTNATPSLFDQRSSSLSPNPYRPTMRLSRWPPPQVSSALASMVGTNTANGTVANPTNSGHRSGPGSGNKIATTGAPGGGLRPGPSMGQAGRRHRRAVQRWGSFPKRAQPKAQKSTPAAPAAGNSAPRTRAARDRSPPPAPLHHPGLMPPYPDARSAQPTMMPNGSMVMPPPVGFIGANMPPRVPKTFIPGMSGLLGAMRWQHTDLTSLLYGDQGTDTAAQPPPPAPPAPSSAAVAQAVTPFWHRL